MPGLPVHHQLPKFTQTHVHWVSDATQPSHPLSSPSPPAFNFPNISVFSNESALCIRWPKHHWSFSFNISPSNEHPSRTDLLYVGLVGSPCSPRDSQDLLQHHSSKASILRHSAFFIVQLLHPYMTTGKTIALTRWTFVGKVTSLLFNKLSRLVIAFLPRSKRLLISWLHLPSAVILKAEKIKSVTVSIVSPSICYEVMGPDAMIFIFLNIEGFKKFSFLLYNTGLVSFKTVFSCSSFTFIRDFLVPLLFLS